MDNRPPSGGRFVAALIWFVLTSAIAVLLLLTALVIWLSTLTGSFILSALIVGGFFAVISVIIYLLSIRDAVEQLRNEIQTVYEVARLAKTGYEWVTDKVRLFLSLREMREK